MTTKINKNQINGLVTPVSYVQIANKTIDTTSETSFIDVTAQGTRGTNVIPANKLQVGDVIMFDIEGRLARCLTQQLLGAQKTRAIL